MFNKSSVAQIRKDVDAALAAVAAKHGVTFSLGTIRFNSESMRCTMSAAVNNTSTGAAEPLEYKELKLKGVRILGINENDLSKTFKSPSLGSVKLIGYHASKYKYPFIVETVSGKRYKLTTTAVRGLLASAGV
jgi:hypothetical protein